MKNISPGTYFITGTDTDAGKTICTKALLQSAKAQCVSTLAYKPIAAGCIVTEDGLRNSDALILQHHCTTEIAYNLVNPIAFEQPIAPHIAAKKDGTAISIGSITEGLRALEQYETDYILVEGAGGWHLPINQQQLLSEWVIEQKMPVILVVGLKLGCLNHALLTAQTIQQSGLTLVGWIANHLQSDMPYVTENINSLVSLLKAPLLAEIPYLNNIDEQDLSQYINVNFMK